MRKSRFTEEKIIKALRRVEGGEKHTSFLLLNHIWSGGVGASLPTLNTERRSSSTLNK